MALLPEPPRNVTGNYDQASKEITETLRRCGFLPEGERVYLKQIDREPSFQGEVRYRGPGVTNVFGGYVNPGDLNLTFAVGIEPLDLEPRTTLAEFTKEQAGKVKKPGVTVTIVDQPLAELAADSTRFDRGTQIKLVGNGQIYNGFVYEAEAGDRVVVKLREGLDPKGKLIARIYADAWRLTASGGSGPPILEALSELRYEPVEEVVDR